MLSDGRVQCTAGGQVDLKLKTRRRDGTTTHPVLRPRERMQRLPAPCHDRVCELRLRRSALPIGGFVAPNPMSGRTLVGRELTADPAKSLRSIRHPNHRYRSADEHDEEPRKFKAH